jgi:hypothetical protein
MSTDITLSNETDEKVAAWLQRHFGGQLVRFSRQMRWREAWDADVRTAQGVKALYVRGSKGSNYFGPVSIEQEAKLHGIMERHGVPVPHVHGMIEDPIAVVMDRVPGQINLTTAKSDAARRAIRTQYVEALAKLHAIPVEEFGALGLPLPSGAQQIAMNLYGPCEQIYRERMQGRPLALMDFLWAWLNRNVPQERTRAAFITADSGQFLFEDDRLTALIDFEVGYVGDPAAEFAGMRLRDSTEPMGDLSALADEYQMLTGDRIDKATIEFHTAGFTAVNGFLLWPMAFTPVPEQDYVAYLSFAVGTSRWAIDAIAAHQGIQLEPVEPPQAAPLAFPQATSHLIGAVARLNVEGDLAAYERERATCLARYLERWNAYGASITAQNLKDASELIGQPLRDAASAETALTDFVRTAGPDQDSRLVRYFHRWLGRHDFLLRECGSSAWLVGLRLQTIPPR